MNKDQIKGQVKNVAGKAQEEAGKIIGSGAQQVKGIKRQDEGKLQKSFGDAKSAVKKGQASVKDTVREM